MNAAEDADVTGTIELSGGLLHLKWSPGDVVTERDARTLMHRARALSGGRALPMLVEMTGLEWIDQGALKAFAGTWPVKCAAVVGTSPVDQTLADFYMGRHKPAHPTRYFTSMDEALAWLNEDAPLV
ncbi:DUF7793 family protein [Pseudarthrobacter niigatensis]|uniref:DUF7793 domain-containing protein n=1 Tax=Pseudarthrobacter niigatensis TaxID=369935 RepID=A0AAJ1WFT1_9MICC|nr:STAS/SEC14 domain-containing protein [Pseudarthrobacter niigatensis]MDQ0146025.1 hypothetical protein [Pseudarthrobacter niigatensis]MDQ0266247.1 hypothetical protein [Pseudarthrobacter niigatensis]